MIRKIVDIEYYKQPSCPRNSRGSVVVTLDCGHQKHYKYSQKPKNHVHCKDCDYEQSQERSGRKKAGG